jgi:hypothetical protein
MIKKIYVKHSLISFDKSGVKTIKTKGSHNLYRFDWCKNHKKENLSQQIQTKKIISKEWSFFYFKFFLLNL